MANLTHLHLHTEYSLLDGVGKISAYVQRARELGMTSIAITDHGNLFGAMEFYKQCQKANIKPIIGSEMYLAEKSINDKDGRIFHLILVAKNSVGYRNLLHLSTKSYEQGFYKYPRIDKEMLKDHHEGLIALSACMKGELSQYVLSGADDETIDKVVDSYIDIFGKDNYYIEVQANGIISQYALNDKLYDIARRNNVGLVATNDVHYVQKGEHELQDIVICIQTGAKLNDSKRMRVDSKGLYFKSYDEMREELGEKYYDAIDNTQRIADMVNLDIEFGKFKFPNYQLPEGYSTVEEYLRHLVRQGIRRRYGQDVERSTLERTKYEIEVIEKMGYAEYFVVVWDFVNYSKSQGIPIGPGRGSAAGSIVAYALGITELDPIKYNLIFERFLNPERISMPDIDIDICQERRQEVIDYVTDKYGNDKVAQIITFGTLKARAVIRDVGRVMDVPLKQVDTLTKMIPYNASLDDMEKNNPEFMSYCQREPQLMTLLQVSKKLENKVRHASIHAAGMVITRDPLTDVVPLYSDSHSTTMSTQYQAKELEDLGLLKMDFLGLRNLTILKRCIDYVRENTGEQVVLENLPLDDKKVYQMLSRGDTTGVFQLESVGIRKILTRLKPDKFEDIIAVLALYRPGPLGSGMVDDFINCKNGRSAIKYPDDSLKDILEETYGVILYQEQVMKIASKMASFSLGEADLLRRAMSKKNEAIMEQNKEKFVQNAMQNGYDKKKAEEIFTLIDKFAGYGFNKSHSAAYALVAYWTAYCKINYMQYYYAAILTSGMNHTEDVAFYVSDAKQHGVKLFLPNVNNPSDKFKVDKEGIVFSLTAIKGMGTAITEGIVAEHNNGDFESYIDFVVRMKPHGLNRKNLEALVLSGALDVLPGSRNQKHIAMDKALDFAGRKNAEDPIQQMNLFGDKKMKKLDFALPETQEFTDEVKLANEKELLGFYFSSHPLDRYQVVTDALKLDPITDIADISEGKHVRVYGILHNVKKVITKKTGDVMCVFELEDYSGSMSGIIFPRDYENYANRCEEGRGVYIQGNIQTDYFKEEQKKLVAKKIEFLEDVQRIGAKSMYVLLYTDDKVKFPLLKKFLAENPGDCQVIFASIEGNKKVTKNSGIKVTPSMRLLLGIEKLLGKKRVVLK